MSPTLTARAASLYIPPFIKRWKATRGEPSSGVTGSPSGLLMLLWSDMFICLTSFRWSDISNGLDRLSRMQKMGELSFICYGYCMASRNTLLAYCLIMPTIFRGITCAGFYALVLMLLRGSIFFWFILCGDLPNIGCCADVSGSGCFVTRIDVLGIIDCIVWIFAWSSTSSINSRILV